MSNGDSSVRTAFTQATIIVNDKAASSIRRGPSGAVPAERCSTGSLPEQLLDGFRLRKPASRWTISLS